MKRNNKQLSTLAETIEPSTLRMVYINEEVISHVPETETTTPKVPAKLFVTEPLPLFNDYRIKARDYDPL